MIAAAVQPAGFVSAKFMMTKPPNPFRWFDSSPEVIRLVVMMYVKYRHCHLWTAPAPQE
jgi:hypothetical protein